MTFRRGERKDDRTRQYLRDWPGDEGVLYIGKAQEKAKVVRTERNCQMLCCARPSLERGDDARMMHHGAPKLSVRPGGSRIPPGKGWPPAGTECA